MKLILTWELRITVAKIINYIRKWRFINLIYGFKKRYLIDVDTLKKVSSLAFVQNYLQSIFENNFSFIIQTTELENEL